MGSKDFKLKTSDGSEIFVYKWLPENPVAVVQIAHGMAEHAGRYDRFAQKLMSKGYAVYANDHRGHGKTAGTLDNVGYFADADGWQRVVEDMRELTATIHNNHPDLPVFLFGHSMGSFLFRNYIFSNTSDINGVILSGTGNSPKLLISLGKLVAAWQIKAKGARGKTMLMHNMTFGPFNKPFRPSRTDFDWLSRDNEEVDKYIDDPFCGGVFTAGFYKDLMAGLQQIGNMDNIEKIRKDLPILLFAGDLDPVGNKGKAVQQVYEIYRKAGIKDVSCRLYKDGRHEMLNETNRQEVYDDIIAWMKNHC
ncbi:MAG: lysophospholipase [Deltaproteobacteria bacterium]|nr:lysophospholipase [Deltaproteobacteria bacterium]